jgi:hypothetical protein
MTIKKMGSLAAMGLAVCLAHNASAVDYNWTGLAGDGLWSSASNWNNGLPFADATQITANVFLAAANGSSSITIPSGYTADLSAATDYGTVFGPEWGATLNIYGSLSYYWYLAPIGGAGNPSIINLYTNSSLSGEGIGLGYNWWFNAAPYVVMNMYSNAQANVNWFWLGGQLNIHGGSLSVAGGFNDGVSDAVSDFTRHINITGGELVLPAGFTSRANDWLGRGILLAYGKMYATNDIIIDEASATYPGRTVVTVVPLGGTLQVTHLQTRSNMMVGTFQQATLLGDYPSVTNAVLSYLDPATVPVAAYQSSDSNVITVTTAGLVRAISPGTATVTVTFGAFSNTNSITVTPYAVSLAHRYSFSESSGTTTADSIGGSTWNGTLSGGASLSGGQVALDGIDGHVQLPAGIIRNLDTVTIEAWATFNNEYYNGACLYAFGDTDPDTGNGRNYVLFQPHTLTTNIVTGISGVNPGNANGRQQNAQVSGVLNGQTNLHIVAVYHPFAGYLAFYTNGVLVANNNNIMTPLASALGEDPLNYLGRSLYSSDPTLDASINEFRIYSGALRLAEIQADYLLGPNQLIGTNTNVSLAATLTGGNLMITWPTTSALVDLISSPVLGAGAVWTSVNGTLAVEGGNYKMTVPVSDSAQYFQLRK